MSHIVIDARELRTSSGRYVERLIHYLQIVDKTNEYTILLKSADFKSWEPTNPNFKKHLCDIKEFTFAEQLKFKTLLNGLKPDLVHFAFVQQPILYRGAAVTTIHDLTTLRFINPDKNSAVFRVKQLVYKQVIKAALKKSKEIITISKYVKEDILNFRPIDPNKITVTYESADLIEDTPQVIKSLAGKKFIMYVGRPTPHKNLERLIESFQEIQAAHKDLVLVLAGKKDGNYKRIEAGVKEKKIDNVVFTGFVSEGQLRWLYENCSAYVIPSLSEGFGLPGLEAMAHGAPVVSSDATCLPEIYGEGAVYFDPLDTDLMAQKISEVLDNKTLKDNLIKSGYSQYKKYSWQKMAEETVAVYNKALQ